MYYGYIRAERDGNSAQVQRETIQAFAEERGFSLSSWLEIKSARSEKKSEILSAGDELIVSKLYRLGNDGTRVLSLLKTLLDRGVIIHSVEDVRQKWIPAFLGCAQRRFLLYFRQ